MQTKNNKPYDVIIVGGSYSGLAAALALGRALRRVLVIDSRKPCNRFTPHSHNFLTHDGETPRQISIRARQDVERYESVSFFNGIAATGEKTSHGFSITTQTGESFHAKKLIFATGIIDVLPDIPGYVDCWGISVIHCPYCHGYEVRNERTGILSNGDTAFELCMLISNWTKDLTLYTNGASSLSSPQLAKLLQHNISIVEKQIERVEHIDGHLSRLVFKDETSAALNALYARHPFEQHCRIPESLGCELTEDGFIKVDPMQKTSVPGVFACGDNVSRLRTVANAVSMGTAAGMMMNKDFILEDF